MDRPRRRKERLGHSDDVSTRSCKRARTNYAAAADILAGSLMAYTSRSDLGAAPKAGALIEAVRISVRTESPGGHPCPTELTPARTS
jgi:hypothetical protein